MTMMDAILVFVLAVFIIATAGIGISCYNGCKDSSQAKHLRTTNKNFSIFMLISGVIALMISAYMLASHHKAGNLAKVGEHIKAAGGAMRGKTT